MDNSEIFTHSTLDGCVGNLKLFCDMFICKYINLAYAIYTHIFNLIIINHSRVDSELELLGQSICV